MDLLILDRQLSAALIRQRQRNRSDRYDEVWDGVYVMSPQPLADDEHQAIIGGLLGCLVPAVGCTGLGRVYPGVNVSDRATKWKRNYRCPDTVVFLNGTTAQNKKTHYLGGPDFLVEVVSRHDRSRQKFDFYAKVKTRELLVVDRYPWSLELYRLNDKGMLDLVGRSTLDDPQILTSQVLPLTLRLQPGDERPTIALTHSDGVQTWSA